MEQREEGSEEKTEKIQRKRRKLSSSLSKSAASFIPVDLITEIFLTLPAKSILRFRSVSKLWSSITRNPYITNSLETRPNLLLFFKEGEKFFVFTVSQHNKNIYSQPIDSHSIACPKHCAFTINTESVHGLICFEKSRNPPLVWNPTLRKFLPLPLRKPDQTWRYIEFFLGYDPVEGKHKVVCMHQYEDSDECRILTLGSDQESWRTVKTNRKHIPLNRYRTAFYGPCRCINGVLYYQAIMGDDFDRVMMSFDVRSEEFSMINLPWEFKKWDVMMISYQGRLACIDSSDEKSLLMWVLVDAEKQEWSSNKFLLLSHYDPSSVKKFKLIGMSNDGELIYVPNRVLKSFCVIYIDPMRERCRRVEYRGIADKDFRQRHGLGDKALRDLQYFHNHIETLRSL